MPTSMVNREYFLQNQDAELAKRDDNGPGGALGNKFFSFNYLFTTFIISINGSLPKIKNLKTVFRTLLVKFGKG